MRQPKYSIVIPVYKAERYLRRCIDSVLAQTEQEWELILVDDGSPDHSGIICDEYAAKDCRISVYHKVNGGVSSARNLGITKAIGEWLTFIDADDWIDSNYLESFRCETENKDVSVYIQGIVMDVPDGRKGKIMFSYHDLSFNYEDDKKWYDNEVLLNGCPVAKLFLRKLVQGENISFNEEISLNEDHLFVTDYFHYVEKVNLCSAVGYHYFFDYKVESLTKTFHRNEEFLKTATLISNSLNILCNRIGKPAYSICKPQVHYLFGLKQIVMASLSAIQETSSMEKFRDCINKYLDNNDIRQITPIGFYSKLFCYCAESKSYYVGYVGAITYYNTYRLYRFFVNIIKKNILRR